MIPVFMIFMLGKYIQFLQFVALSAIILIICLSIRQIQYLWCYHVFSEIDIKEVVRNLRRLSVRGRSMTTWIKRGTRWSKNAYFCPR